MSDALNSRPLRKSLVCLYPVKHVRVNSEVKPTDIEVVSGRHVLVLNAFMVELGTQVKTRVSYFYPKSNVLCAFFDHRVYSVVQVYCHLRPCRFLLRNTLIRGFLLAVFA